MGGNVFTTVTKPLLTPRMPPAVYFYIRHRCHTILSEFYTHLCTPLEAPEKTSYGDIDILACGPLSASPTLIADIGRALDAVHIISPPASSPDLPIHFALPWPRVAELPDHNETAEPAETIPPEAGGQPRFIQLDLVPLPDHPTFRFQAFTHAHSGLFTVLGSALQHAGLVLTQSALSLRIPAIEAVRRRNSTAALTADPDQILAFLGLDRARYWAPFASEADMFAYAASCRLFTTRRSEGETAEAEAERAKHRDRKNKRRPLFVRWREDFVPRAREARSHDREVPAREVVREEAFARWPAARGAYEAKLLAFETGLQEEEVARIIAAEVPVDVEALGLPLGTRGVAVKGLRKIVFEEDGSYDVAPQKPFKGQDGAWDVESVRGFVRTHWEEVGRIGMQRGHARMVEKMSAKKAEKTLAKELEG